MAVRWAKALLKLQAVDLKIRDLEARLALLPKEMGVLKDKRDATVAAVNDTATAAKKIERDRKSVESEIQAMDVENKRLQQQSAMVKKNNEYQAMLSTIALNRKKIGDLENREIELLEKYETAKKHYSDVKRDNTATVNTLRSEFEELIAFAAELKKEIAELKAERPADIRGVDAETLSLYQRLLGGKDAVAPLVKVENGFCGGCHLKLTRQTMTNLQKGAVTSCENCMHLLYLDEVE